MSTNAQRGTPGTQPDAQPKIRLAETIAAKIEAEIFRMGWPVGQVLGSETELIERYEVSRAVFREAIRIVEHHNVARMRRGPGGGLVVTEPDPSAVHRAMALYLRYQNVTREDLAAPRMALELAAVEAAAAKIDEAGIERLREVLAMEEEMGSEAVQHGHTHHLHVVIAELTQNPALVLFMSVLGQLNEEMAAGADEYPIDIEVAASESHRAHVAIVDAIASGDAALAQHRMRRHVEAIRDFPANQP